MRAKELLKKYQIWLEPLIVGGFFGLAWQLVSHWSMNEALLKSIESAWVQNFFLENNWLAGWLLAVALLLIAYAWLGILKAVNKLSINWLRCCGLVAVLSAWLMVGGALIYRESAYSDVVKGLLAFSAWPLLVASGVTLGTVFWIAYRAENDWKQKACDFRNLMIVGCLVSLLSLTLMDFGKIIYQACQMTGDQYQDQCYGWAAVQASRLEWCEEIGSNSFVGMAMNPPRDKCYLQIAKTAGSLAACDQIRGGLMSYSRADCLHEVAKKFFDPRACERLKDLEAVRCEMALLISISPDKIAELDTEIARTRDVIRKKALQERREAIILHQSSRVIK